MSFRLISLLFKFGHFLGTTPSSLHVPKTSRLKKFYYLLIFVVFTYGFIARGVIQLRSHSRKPIIFLYIITHVCLHWQQLGISGTKLHDERILDCLSPKFGNSNNTNTCAIYNNGEKLLLWWFFLREYFIPACTNVTALGVLSSFS